MINRKKISRTVCSLFVGLMLSAQVYAGSPDIKIYRDGQVPDPTEVASILSNVGGKVPAKHVRKSRGRGIVLLDDDAPVNTVQATGEQERMPSQVVMNGSRGNEGGNFNMLAIPVKFTSSNDVSPESYAVLDAVAAGIKQTNNEGKSKRKIVIEAHTDQTSKSKSYNVTMSKEQAEAVRNFLVYKHNIDARTLELVGKGRNEPLNKRNQNAEGNARVQFYTAEAR